MVVSVVACTSKHQPVIRQAHKTLLAVVIDYSRSYQRLTSIDSSTVSSMFLTVANTSGTLVHVPVQSNSSVAPVFMQRVEKLDTSSVIETNVYQAARARSRTRKQLEAFYPTMQSQVSAFLSETRKYPASSFTDLQPSLQLAQSTVCESIYTNGKVPYRRFVLILSDMLSDPPHRKPSLVPMDFQGATILIVRPSTMLSTDSLRTVFRDADVHTFTTIHDAISFINEQ